MSQAAQDVQKIFSKKRLVCPFHSLDMISHEVKEKDGTITKGVHCPKCFVQNGVLVDTEEKVE